MKSVFKKINLEVTRYSAITPDNVKDGIHGSPTQKACAQSHINIWRYIIEKNLPYALILEDDIVFDKNWLQKLQTFPYENFDLIMLNTNNFASQPHIWRNTESNCFFTGGYIVSKNTIKTLLKGPYCASDRMLLSYQKSVNNIGCYSYFPYLIIQTYYDSDIQGSLLDQSKKQLLKELDSINYNLENYIF